MATVLCSSSIEWQLPMPYFNHLCHLVAAIHIVLSDAIEEVDLLNAHKFLKTFYSQYAELYGNFSSLWMSIKSQF